MKHHKILLLAANPKDTGRLRLQEEERDIKEQLRLAGFRRPPISSEVAVRPRDIYRSVLDTQPTIVHFSGHGAGNNGLIFENALGQSRLISSDALAELFRLFSQKVECVILNACYSYSQAEVIAEHVNYVIGMHEEIEDASAIEFSVGFYSALSAGESIEFAYKMGCVAIRMNGYEGNVIPQLLKKPNVRQVSHRPIKEISSRVILLGSRNSGKSTYLSALSAWSDLGFAKPVISVEGGNHGYSEYEKGLLLSGERLEPTAMVREHSLSIEIEPPKNQALIGQGNLKIYLDCLDYPGEIYRALPTSKKNYWENDVDRIKNNLKFIILIDSKDDVQSENDHIAILKSLKQTVGRSEIQIAITFSKSDSIGLWNSRSDPQEYARTYFPNFYRSLKELSAAKACSVEFFACSAFGMQGIPPKANLNEYGGIADPIVWQPIGLVGPIYWLATGTKDGRLEGLTTPYYIEHREEIREAARVRKQKKPLMTFRLLILILFIAASVSTFAGFQYLKFERLNICKESWLNPEDQLFSISELIQADNAKNLPQHCLLKRDILLLETGIEQASRGLVAVAVRRFCQISKTSEEQFYAAQSYLMRWLENEWNSVVIEQLSRVEESCPIYDDLS